MSNDSLKGRKALVTGAARGLGAGIAQAYANAGASVVIADLLEKEGEATAASIRASGQQATFVKLDVTDEPSWERAITAAIADLGGLDCVVNNAGHRDLRARRRHRSRLAPQDARREHRRRRARHEARPPRDAPPMGAAGKGGSILNIASVAATIAFPGIAGYSGTKSAVDRMTRIAAMESGKLGYGVRVNCMYPGLVATQMGIKLAEDIVALGLAPSVEAAIGNVVGLTPLGRLGEVVDMADAAVFLASDAARFITGIGLPVDGGMGM